MATTEQEQLTPSRPESPPPSHPEGSPQAPQSPQQDAAPQEGGGSPPSVELNHWVTLPGGKRVQLHDLVQQAEAADTLAQYKEHASRLLRGDIAGEAREASIRHVMSEEGYAPEQIEEYIMQVRQEQNPTRDEPPQEGGYVQDAPAPSGVSTEQDQPSYDELRRRLDEVEGRQSQTDLQQMQSQLRTQLDHRLDAHNGLRILLEKSQALNGEGDEARNIIRDELERQTMDFLRVRKSRGERFNMDWFQEESEKAAEAVFKKYRSVIGDPDKLQRAPETESGQESLLRKPPLPPPTYERGDGRPGADKKAHDYTTDVLNRLAMGLEGGQETKV